MKRVICLIFLIAVLSGISYITYYTLNNKGVKENVNNKIVLYKQKISSNVSDNSLVEVFSVYLNNNKHKLKFEYVFVNNDDNTSNLNLMVYFDGKALMEQIINTGKYKTFKDLLDNDELMTSIKLAENDIIIFESSNDYLILNIKYFEDNYNYNKYFIFDDKGAILTEEEGLLAYKSNINYINSDINNFYLEDDKQVLAKINKNVIYVLVEKKVNKKINLEEYKYYIKDEKLISELINTYKNVKSKKV